MAEKPSGYILLHRSLQEHWLWEEKRVFSKAEAWIDILMLVNFKPGKTMFNGQLCDVDRGERVTSNSVLANRWGWGETTVKRFLKMLADDGMITIKADNKKTTLKVLQYDVYQLNSGENGQQTDGKKLSKNFQANRKKLSNGQQTVDELINDNELNKSNAVNALNNHQDNEDADALIKFVEQELAIMLSPVAIDEINAWLTEWEDREVIKLAICESVRQNKRSIAYVSAVLGNWRKRQLKTVAQAQEAIDEFEKQKATKAAKGKPGTNGAKKPDNFASTPRDLSFLEE